MTKVFPPFWLSLAPTFCPLTSQREGTGGEGGERGSATDLNGTRARGSPEPLRPRSVVSDSIACACVKYISKFILVPLLGLWGREWSQFDNRMELLTKMSSVNTVEEDEVPILNHRTPCLQSSNLALCTCDDAPPDGSENSPLISSQNHNHNAGSDRYLTDIHCHEAKPIYSNARARRKLLIASIVCLLFVAAEVVGKVLRYNVLCLIC